MAGIVIAKTDTTKYYAPQTLLNYNIYRLGR